MTWGGPMRKDREMVGGDGVKSHLMIRDNGETFWQCDDPCGAHQPTADRAFEHMARRHQPVTEAAQLSQLKAELTAAIEKARMEGRVEGRMETLDEAAAVAMREADDYASTWGENSAGDKAIRRVSTWASERLDALEKQGWGS